MSLPRSDAPFDLIARQPESNSPYVNTSNPSLPNSYYSGLQGVNLQMDNDLSKAVAWFLGGVALVVLTLRAWQLFSSHLRHIYCLTASKTQQNYWSYDRGQAWPWIKRNIISAPLGTKRHNRELQLSRAHNYGTLPSRIHTLFLVVYVLGQAGFCAWLDYSDKKSLLAQLRGRSGMLAVVNMVPLVLMAGRNNPAIPLLKISYDTFNLFHRWIGRIIIIQSVVHTLAWYGAVTEAKGPGYSNRAFGGVPFLQYGLTAMILMAVIMIQSLSPVRHAFYETFKYLHQMLAFFVIMAVYLHLELAKLPALPYIRLAVIFWGLERGARLARIAYLNHAWRTASTSVLIEALPAGACRVTFSLPRNIKIKPGSHVFIYLPKISWMCSHPFSVAWTDTSSEPLTGCEASSSLRVEAQSPSELEKLALGPDYIVGNTPTTLSLIVSARSGMTKKMYDLASHSSESAVTMKGWVEGPYGGHLCLSSYGTVIMFAGGVGITHHLIQVRHLLACAYAKTVATRKIVLVWTVRDPVALSWVKQWMDEVLLQIPSRREMLKILLYVSRATNPTDYHSPSNTIQVYQGHCSPAAVLDQELPQRVGATAVSVCGPGAFADDVRAACRERMHSAVIDLDEEAFTW